MKEEWVYVVLARWGNDYTVDGVYVNKKFADKRVEWLRERGVDTRIYRYPIILE